MRRTIGLKELLQGQQFVQVSSIVPANNMFLKKERRQSDQKEYATRHGDRNLDGGGPEASVVFQTLPVALGRVSIIIMIAFHTFMAQDLSSNSPPFQQH